MSSYAAPDCHIVCQNTTSLENVIVFHVISRTDVRNTLYSTLNFISRIECSIDVMFLSGLLLNNLAPSQFFSNNLKIQQ